ncbi:MAG: hypothetical protein ABJF10_00820 [Chthoniobacter sp.]|uniref:hypothetical protein n=1 Tax=Chthoniobacter sp. TaxID=2510640 RepID=UPI0032A8347E
MNDLRSTGFRILSALVCCGLLVITFVCQSENGMAGFPDGHLTDYDKAIATPYHYLCIASLLFCLYFAWLAIVKSRKTGLRLMLGFAVYLLVIVLPAVALKYYFLHWLQLDNGIGG